VPQYGRVPFEGDYDQLILIAGEAAAEEEWRGYASYLTSRGRGLRRDALAALDLFLTEATGWPFRERLRLTRWIGDRRARVFDTGLLMPQPLHARLISPTVLEWVKEEPSCAEAHFLVAVLADFPAESRFAQKPFHLRRAIALQPTHEEAKLRLCSWLTSEAEYNQHHIPWSYLGDAATDLQVLQEAEAVVDKITNPFQRESRRAEVVQLRKVASAWLAFRRSGHENFGEWCAEHGIDIGIRL
jgi:hypothetical protein